MKLNRFPVALLFPLSLNAWSATHYYTVTDLGVLPGADWSLGRGLSANGQITGVSYINSGTIDHAFLYKSGHMTDLGSLPGADSRSVGFRSE
jgi:probable HAF family extracellular repeat protein